MGEMDIRQIMDILPHRYPLLLIDRIIALEPMVMVRGYKNVTFNEPIFTGHFPNYPVLPGVYQIEAMAQMGGAVVLRRGEFARKIPYLVGINNAKFKRPVIPGDRLDMEIRMLRHKRNIGWVRGEASVDGQIACIAELMFSINSNDRMIGGDSAVLRA
jgi:3-hydroxyacyl-[acyl-carrier-protein] dehydratase